MKLHEKIKNLRGLLDLNRVEFSKKIDTPLNTLKSIELKGSVPGGDILVAIANEWPEYAAWILLGTSDLRDSKTGCFNIVDHVDVRFIEQCIIKNERLSKLIFLQSGEEEDLAALLVIDQSIFYGAENNQETSRAIWLKSGNMNFSRRKGGGWSVLRDFRAWLIETNADLVYKAEFYQIDKSILRRKNLLTSLAKEILTPALDDERYSNFLQWKEGVK